MVCLGPATGTAKEPDAWRVVNATPDVRASDDTTMPVFSKVWSSVLVFAGRVVLGAGNTWSGLRASWVVRLLKRKPCQRRQLY